MGAASGGQPVRSARTGDRQSPRGPVPGDRNPGRDAARDAVLRGPSGTRAKGRTCSSRAADRPMTPPRTAPSAVPHFPPHSSSRLPTGTTDLLDRDVVAGSATNQLRRRSDDLAGLAFSVDLRRRLGVLGPLLGQLAIFKHLLQSKHEKYAILLLFF